MNHLITPSLRITPPGQGATVWARSLDGQTWHGASAPTYADELATEILRLSAALSLASRLESLDGGELCAYGKASVLRRPDAAGGGYVVWIPGQAVSTETIPTAAAAARRVLGIPEPNGEE